MLIVWLGWLRSVELAHWSKFLYEYESAPTPASDAAGPQGGFFKTGWPEAAIWPKLLCMHFDLPTLDQPPPPPPSSASAAGAKANNTVCNFADWKKEKVFTVAP